jgi:hypothetical protein
MTRVRYRTLDRTRPPSEAAAREKPAPAGTGAVKGCAPVPRNKLASAHPFDSLILLSEIDAYQFLLEDKRPCLKNRAPRRLEPAGRCRAAYWNPGKILPTRQRIFLKLSASVKRLALFIPHQLS